MVRVLQAVVMTLPAEMGRRGYEVRAFGKHDVGGTCTENVLCDPGHNDPCDPVLPLASGSESLHKAQRCSSRRPCGCAQRHSSTIST